MTRHQRKRFGMSSDDLRKQSERHPEGGDGLDQPAGVGPARQSFYFKVSE
jgi:hypothetical protein